MGLRGYAGGLLSSAALIGGFAALALLGPVLAALGNHVLITLLISAVSATLLWWPVQRVLLGGRTSWRKLFPGAVLNGAGHVFNGHAVKCVGPNRPHAMNAARAR